VSQSGVRMWDAHHLPHWHAAVQEAASGPLPPRVQHEALPRPAAGSSLQAPQSQLQSPALPLSQAVNAPVDAAGRLTRHLDRLLVVARYREDVRWLDALRPRIPFLVYQVGIGLLRYIPIHWQRHPVAWAPVVGLSAPEAAALLHPA
jgi:hypothetical protein